MVRTIEFSDQYEEMVEEAVEQFKEEKDEYENKLEAAEYITENFVGNFKDHLTILTYSKKDLSSDWNLYFDEHTYDQVIEAMAYDKFKQDLYDRIE